MRYILTLVLLIQFSNVFSNTGLTKSEYQEDINYLIQVIEEVNPQLIPVLKYTGFDIMENIKSLPTVNDEISFYDDINYIVNLCNDKHLGVVYPNAVKELLPQFSEKEAKGLLNFVDTSCFKKSAESFINYDKAKYRNIPQIVSWLDIKYINGEYYNLRPFKVKGIKHEFPSNMKLLKINGLDVHKYIAENNKKLYGLSWDSKNSRFYIASGFTFISLYQNDTINYTFLDPKSGETNVTLNLNKNLKEKSPYITMHLPSVKYFRKENILYIRVPDMENGGRKCITKLKKYINTGKDIDKIIIDIRNNGGGNDYVWYKLLQSVIGKPIKTNIKIGIKNTEMVKQYYGGNQNNSKISKIDFLNNEEFIMFPDTVLSEIKPAKESVNYKGKIYLIQNENIFSSAGSLSALAYYSDNIVSIGRPSDVIAGAGTTPFYFMLPNSKLIIEIAPSLDFSMTNDISDFYNKVDIEFHPGIKYYDERAQKFGSAYTKRFLRKHDELFREVLNIK